MGAGGSGLAKDVDSGTLCACGCGVPAGGHWHRNVYRTATYKKGHNRPYAGRLPQTRAAVRAYHDRSCVPAEPIVRLLRARFGRRAYLWLSKELNINSSGACAILRRPRMRRESAERILAALAGLPRSPSLRERRNTRREKDRLERAYYRRKARAG